MVRRSDAEAFFTFSFWLRNVLCATAACTFWTSEVPKVLRGCCVLQFLLWNLLRATVACTFSTSQLRKRLRTWCVFSFLTSKCASRHNAVQFLISHPATCLRTRSFSEPTFRPYRASRATKQPKQTQFFATFLLLSPLLLLNFLQSICHTISRVCILHHPAFLSFLEAPAEKGYTATQSSYTAVKSCKYDERWWKLSLCLWSDTLPSKRRSNKVHHSACTSLHRRKWCQSSIESQLTCSYMQFITPVNQEVVHQCHRRHHRTIQENLRATVLRDVKSATACEVMKALLEGHGGTSDCIPKIWIYKGQEFKMLKLLRFKKPMQIERLAHFTESHYISLYRLIKFLSKNPRAHMYPTSGPPSRARSLPPSPSSLSSNAVCGAKSTNRCELLWLLKGRRVALRGVAWHRVAAVTPWLSNDDPTIALSLCTNQQSPRESSSLFIAIGTWCSPICLGSLGTCSRGVPMWFELSLCLVGEASWTWRCRSALLQQAIQKENQSCHDGRNVWGKRLTNPSCLM